MGRSLTPAWPPLAEARVGRVHTTTDAIVHIGASATDEAFIDAFADAARVGLLRVHNVAAPAGPLDAMDRLRRIQALAESLDYQCWWQLGIGVDHADLILLEVD